MSVMLIFSLFLFSCNPFTTGGENASTLENEMKQVLKMIHEEIGDAEASDESACRALPIGAKPCGGPWRYLPYSAQQSDESLLEDLSEKYFQLNRKYNEVKGLASDCMYVGEPSVTLTDGRCVIAQNENN